MYTSAPSIVIRASNNADPTVVGYEEVEIAIKVPSFDEPRIGEGEEDIDYNARASKLFRPKFDFSCLQLYVHSGQGSNFQTVAVVKKLRRLWSTYEYMWLYEVREVFGDATPFPWADEEGDDATFFASDHATTPGIMPVRVSLEEVAMSPPGGGYVDCDLSFAQEGI